jgi:hypothetical protein
MLFEMVADIRRHDEDKKANSFKMESATYDGKKFNLSQITTQDLKVGHIIKL